MPDLAVAPVRWLPVGSSPLVAHAWSPSSTLQAAIEAAVGRHQGSISVVATDLDTGATASVNADQQLSSASLYKLFLLQAAYARMATGDLSAQEQLTLGQALADSDPYTDLTIGTRSSVTCALQTMIEISSNSAADLIEDRLSDSAVNAYLLGLGLQKSYITPDHAYTSAADIARLLNGMALGQAVSPTGEQPDADDAAGPAGEQSPAIPAARGDTDCPQDWRADRTFAMTPVSSTRHPAPTCW